MASASQEVVVRVRGLRKSYGTKEALRGIDLDVRRGEVFALLGPNGAGKTTTVEILEGYRERSSGEATVLGSDPSRGDPTVKARVGIVLQASGTERYLTAREIVSMYAGYYPRPRDVDDLLDLVGLADQARTRIKRLSGGQRRRLDLAIGLVGDPELVFLDEPTTGFDPGARRDSWAAIRDLAGQGRSILLTTHHMDEAHALADRLAVLVEGRIVAEGSPAGVIEAHSTSSRVSLRLPEGAPPPPAGLQLRASTDVDGLLWATTSEPTRFLHELTAWALAVGVDLLDLSVARPSLEDVYLALTGHRQDEAAPGTGDRTGGRRS